MFTILRQMPFIACRLCDKIKAVYKYYTGAKQWNVNDSCRCWQSLSLSGSSGSYEAALALLGFFCNLIMPFIIGGCLAFIVNVPLVHIERLWQKLFARFSSDWPQKIKRPVCLIFTLTLIIGIVLIGGLKIGPDLHQSFNMIVKTLPKASAELTVSLKERWSELALLPDTLDYLQSQWSELLRAVDSYWENNKTTLFYNTLNITTSLISLVSNIVIGVAFAGLPVAE